jgi:serine protease
MVLKLSPENRQQVFRALNIASAESNRQLFEADDPDEQLKLDTLRAIDALKKRPDVMFAEPNYIRRTMGEPDDEYYPLQWHYPLIHLPQAWELTTGSSDVIVAVIDTGILSNHPDIDPSRIVDGYDFISNLSISLDGDGIDDNPEDPGDDLEGRSSFHGTHVAGTIGAATNNAIGVAGVTWGGKIMPLRALGNGGGLASDIREAIKYAAGLPNSSGIELPPSRRANIINMSLGGGSRSDLDQQAIDDARKAGVIIIAAAGNFASNAPMYPAAYDGVISVSAVGADKQLAPYSNYGATIDIAAPGGNMSRDYDGDGRLDGVWSTGGNDASGFIQLVYNLKQGTSMAAPHVAGVVALMKSLYPALTPALLDVWLRDEENQPLVEDLGPAGRDNSYGYGLIDAFQAVITAQRAESGEFPTFLYVSPLSLNFGTSNESLDLTAENFGSTNLAYVTITEVEDEPWLEIDGSFDDETQTGTYVVTVDRENLPDGPYAATIILESDVNSVEVSVNMQKGVPTGGDAGYHYVLLLDPDTFVTVAQYDVPAPVNGIYPFSLSAPAGEYILFAGTDSDNDYSVGDPGESAGAYVSMDQPRVIRLNRDRTGYNFTTSFNLNLPTTLAGEAGGYGWMIQGGEGFQIDKP